MPRMVNRLSPTKVANLKWDGTLTTKGQPKSNYHPDGDGLYLQVARGDTKSWIFRFKRNGTARDMGLGPLRDVSLAKAREKARDSREQLRDGFDPIEIRKRRRLQNSLEAARTITFDQAADEFIASHAPAWKNPKHRDQWKSTLRTYASPFFGKLPVADIDTGLVLRALKPIWTDKPETAGRLRGRIEAILGWATTMGYRTGENPAKWRAHLENLLPAKGKVRRVQHHAALPFPEIAALMAELRTHEAVAARALEFTILTAVRTNDALGARWDEIDFDGHTWTIPGARMKAGREHKVPLSEPALAILRAMHETRSGPFVFPGMKVDKPLSNMAMLMLLRRMGRGDLTAHGFRSTFSDWAAERTHFPREVREMALAHTIRDKTEAAYRRGDLFEKRRQLMDAWAAHCNGHDPENVVLMRARG